MQEYINKQRSLQEHVRYLSKTIARLQEENADLEYDMQQTDCSVFKGGFIDQIYNNDMFIEEKTKQLQLLQHEIDAIEKQLENQ